MSDTTASETSRRDSILSPVFIVGCGRSGTTWLQLLLAQHPAVASAPETHVFSRYLALLDRRWQQETEYRRVHNVRTGVQELIDDDDFTDLLHTFARRVLGRIHDSEPQSSIILEKSPDHVHVGGLILQCFPQARFIHVIRDPRAVVASFRAASRSWGKHWAPRGVVEGAEQWRDAVAAGMEIERRSSNVFRVHYENLLASPAQVLGDIFRWLELDYEDIELEKYIDACRIDKLRESEDPSSARSSLAPTSNHRQFFHRGSAHAWRSDLSNRQVAMVESVAGSLMKDLGYSANHDSRRPIMWRKFVRRLVAGLAWRFEHAASWLHDRL